MRSLSVVVPVAPGETAWPALLRDLGALPAGAQVILAAAAPAPQPPAALAAAARLACELRWIESAAGRARQQNAGARAADGELLWFLHADSRLTPGALTALARLDGGEFLAWFRLRFERDGPPLAALNAAGANLRARLLSLPFGDQGFVLPRAGFFALGGFDERLALGEDLDLALRARAAGFRMTPLKATLLSSARRYREQGWLATTLRHAHLTWSLARAARARIAAAPAESRHA